ncbi:MAG: PhoH family protein [Spirochaetales bacterium]|uniref:PhoH-like protein n=1 Tax=Candidatus Thalassospirochaeta sargassi TaxID=3119039 RepID=A0AAJ1IG00_9SPIO|nr:PhoH family protein [Spirochaetales bacterium]
MSNSLTIVLEDHEKLTDICGVNDENLIILEKLTGTKVYSRGNEIHIDSPEEKKQVFFRELINKLQDYQSNGRLIEPVLINSVAESMLNDKKEDKELFDKKCIMLPGGTRVYPRSARQASYIESIENNEIVFGVGPAGTGKTYLAVAAALREVLSKNKRKLIITRPVVEAGESLGFLPGDLTQKLNPYLKPIYDSMDSFLSYETIQRMEESRLIEIAPLAYMRGRSLTNSFIILDEAQNTTKTQMKMFLTRIGEGSQAIITGDITQVDLPGSNKSGLIHAVDILKGIDGLSFTFFDTKDVVRKRIVKHIIQAYERSNKK